MLKIRSISGIFRLKSSLTCCALDTENDANFAENNEISRKEIERTGIKNDTTQDYEDRICRQLYRSGKCIAAVSFDDERYLQNTGHRLWHYLLPLLRAARSWDLHR